MYKYVYIVRHYDKSDIPEMNEEFKIFYEFSYSNLKDAKENYYNFVKQRADINNYFELKKKRVYLKPDFKDKLTHIYHNSSNDKWYYDKNYLVETLSSSTNDNFLIGTIIIEN